MNILACNTVGTVTIFYIFKTFLTIIRLAIPLILILKITFDFYKNMNLGNDKENILKKSTPRIVAAILIFLVPTLINLFISLLSKTTSIENSNTTIATCYSEANLDLIKKLKQEEELKLDNIDEEKRKQSLANYAVEGAKAAKLAEENRKREEEAELNKKNNNSGSNNNNGNTSSSGNSTYSSNLTDMNKQNGVYIKDGYFYKPKFKSGNPNTYSGKNCPSNPLSQGYNNKYGYNNYFYTMLQNLVEGAKKNGYKLVISNQGCRSYSIQERFFRSMEKGRAARPGRSNHGWGIASDVTFYKNLTDTCSSYRTKDNCKGMAWVHEHAKDYGLHFPLLTASYKEDWHIEPMNLKTY